jgi:hypothetical protein
MHMEENVFDILYEPLAGATLTNLLQLTAQNKGYISIRYLPRMLYSYTMASLMAPFRLREHIRYNNKIHHTSLKEDPLFIIGHWRSGTTYLHNMITINKQFGYCSTFTATMPGIFLTAENLLKPLLIASIPDKRPMDDVAMGADLPQEEEYAIGGLIPYAYYNGWCFPRNMAFYNDFVTMQNSSPSRVEQWKSTYRYLLKKLTIYNKGRQLALKNPANTGRIRILLDMFPNAKFIHIYRNPYEVYYSMMKFLCIVIPRYCVQRPPSIHTIQTHMMKLYTSMYRQYLAEKHLIPPEHLIEVRYEEFIEKPVEEIKRIYTDLNLPHYTENEQQIIRYATSQRKFKTSSYNMDNTTKKHIYDQWQFAFKEFNYNK